MLSLLFFGAVLIIASEAACPTPPPTVKPIDLTTGTKFSSTPLSATENGKDNGFKGRSLYYEAGQSRFPIFIGMKLTSALRPHSVGFFCRPDDLEEDFNWGCANDWDFVASNSAFCQTTPDTVEWSVVCKGEDGPIKGPWERKGCKAATTMPKYVCWAIRINSGFYPDTARASVSAITLEQNTEA